MKTALRPMLTVAICMALISVYGQHKIKVVEWQEGSRGMPTSGTSVAISLKNLSNNKVTVFVGPKGDLANPKARQKVYESQSSNTIYASVNEEVCIIGTDEKPISCVDVLTGTEKLEIDATGTVISIAK
jgi:hypothetical protein